MSQKIDGNLQATAHLRSIAPGNKPSVSTDAPARPVEAADGMVMRGRAAMLDGRGRAGAQHFHELVQCLGLVEDAAEGEIEAGPVGIDVGKGCTYDLCLRGIVIAFIGSNNK